MSNPPACQASAVLRAALRAGAADARAHGIAALLLALLLRLFGASETAWTLSHDDAAYDDCGFDRVAFADASLHASPIYQPQIGRAPHDIFVECGLVPGYVMAGIHNRGMRAIRGTRPQPRRTRPAPGFT